MGKILKIILLIALSTVGLYFAFYNVDFNNLLNHLKKVDLPKFFAAIIILMVSCIIRAKRLQYILVPLDNNISFGSIRFPALNSRQSISLNNPNPPSLLQYLESNPKMVNKIF